MSTSEKNEFDFYHKFELEVGFSLSTNFKDNLGISSKTSYDWRSAPKSTWQNETNVLIEIESSPLCKIEIFEIVGKCSYMNIRPYHLERVDKCEENSSTTNEIPSTILPPF